MKVCIKCNTNHSLEFYYKSKSWSDGYNAVCKPCMKLRGKVQRDKHKDRRNAETRVWKANNKDRVKAYNKEYKATHRDSINVATRLWVLNNREKYLVVKNACSASRRAKKKCATVEWADHKKIKEFYREALRLTLLTGIQHHVDHIYPLLSPLVCGLHCEANLQILPYYENLSKGNKLIEDIV